MVDGQRSSNLQVDYTPVSDEIPEAENYHTRSLAKTNGVAETQEAKVRHRCAAGLEKSEGAPCLLTNFLSSSSTHPTDQNDCTHPQHSSVIPSTKIVRLPLIIMA